VLALANKESGPSNKGSLLYAPGSALVNFGPQSKGPEGPPFVLCRTHITRRNPAIRSDRGREQIQLLGRDQAPPSIGGDQQPWTLSDPALHQATRAASSEGAWDAQYRLTGCAVARTTMPTAGSNTQSVPAGTGFFSGTSTKSHSARPSLSDNFSALLDASHLHDRRASLPLVPKMKAPVPTTEDEFEKLPPAIRRKVRYNPASYLVREPLSLFKIALSCTSPSHLLPIPGRGNDTAASALQLGQSFLPQEPGAPNFFAHTLRR
jgi:hypothetical protein